MASSSGAPSSTKKRKVATTGEPTNYSGYIQKVSPIKQSGKGNSYFNSVLQTSKDEFRDMVIYNSKIHRLFTTAQEKKSPVKLLKCSPIPGLKSQLDIAFGSESAISFQDKLDFKHRNYRAPAEQEKKGSDKKLKETVALPLGQKVNVRGKIVCTLEQEKEVIAYGVLKKVKKMLICDEEACMPLGLWQQARQEVQEEASYYITELSIKEFDRQRYLSTTTDSKITLLTDDVQPGHLKDILTNYQGDIAVVQVQVSASCQKCKDFIKELLDSKLYRCSCCNTLQKTQDISTNKTCSLMLRTNENTENLNIAGPILQNFLTKIGCTKNDDSSTIEETILEIGPVDILAHNSTVVQITLMETEI